MREAVDVMTEASRIVDCRLASPEKVGPVSSFSSSSSSLQARISRYDWFSAVAALAPHGFGPARLITTDGLA